MLVVPYVGVGRRRGLLGPRGQHQDLAGPHCRGGRPDAQAAHLSDHVSPRLPVRQWVLSVPKRLRYYLQRDKGTLNAALRIFLRVVQQSLKAHCSGAAKADPASLHLGAVAFIHRFGSSLNTHVHFHVCVVDGVFEQRMQMPALTRSPLLSHLTDLVPQHILGHQPNPNRARHRTTCGPH